MAYTITHESARTMLGKRTGKIRASIIGADRGVPAYQVEGDTPTEAKQALLNGLGTLAEHQHKRRYLFCGDGQTILVVYMLTDGAAYDIISADRPHPSGCMTSLSFDACVKAAESHAEQSYGGVRRSM